MSERDYDNLNTESQWSDGDPLLEEFFPPRDEATVATEFDHWNPESHWDDHPDHPAGDWITEVENGDTRQSYVAWVNSQIEPRIDDEAQFGP